MSEEEIYKTPKSDLMKEQNDSALDPETKKRGFWLSSILILGFVASPITAYLYFSEPQTVLSFYPAATLEIVYFLGVMSVVNLGIIAAIWTWRKIGLYAVYATSALAFCINIYIGIGVVESISGLVGPLIIFLTTRNKSHFFK